MELTYVEIQVEVSLTIVVTLPTISVTLIGPDAVVAISSLLNYLHAGSADPDKTAKEMSRPAQERQPCKCRDRWGQEDHGEVLYEPEDEILHFLHTKPPKIRQVQ